VAELRDPHTVDVAEGDSREGHLGAVLLAEQCDVVVLQVVDDAVGHLVEEDGEGEEEGQRP